jgi:hypothetical protein
VSGDYSPKWKSFSVTVIVLRPQQNERVH